MRAAAGDHEQANEDAAQARPEACVVVARAAPAREAVGEEVVVACALGPAQDGGYEAEAGEALRGFLSGLLDLARGGGFGDVDGRFGAGGGGFGLGGRARGGQGGGGFVRVELTGAFAVGFADLVLRGGGFDVEEVWGWGQGDAGGKEVGGEIP